ncbi:MAG: phosphate ABC transporter substrate-binding protein PstS family protein [Anaerolineae bacterium]|nr:phosphate ABC transporter substrate-binding protein PstS family protein [Anaerolineae bacterium]
MKARIIAVIALIAVLVAPLAAINAQGGKTIVDIAIENGNFTTLVTALQLAGLVDTLKGAGPFTVFAPTDEAFAKVPGYVVDYVTKPENKDLLVRILTYHVLPGKALAADAMNLVGKTAKTVEGGEVAFNMVGNDLKINSAKIVATDIEASNGVIHVIDSVILPEITLPEVNPAAVKGNIISAGSSTVFPLTRAVADLFRAEGFADNVEVASIGTGAGFERFCKAGETDISNASRRIRASERADCEAIGRTPQLEFFVAIDALAVVVSVENKFVDNLTLEQLAAIFSGEVKTWNQVNPSWPAEEIKLFSPGTDSGTFDYFVEVIFKRDSTKLLNANPQLSEDDNVLVEGVSGSPNAIGYFGYAYALPNAARVRPVAINGVEPNFSTAESGAYPLARPLFIYTTPAIMQEKPQVAAFVNFYLQNLDKVLGTEPGKVAYFPVSSDALNLSKLAWLAGAGE